jgi:hypothetical protein
VLELQAYTTMPGLMLLSFKRKTYFGLFWKMITYSQYLSESQIWILPGLLSALGAHLFPSFMSHSWYSMSTLIPSNIVLLLQSSNHFCLCILCVSNNICINYHNLFANMYHHMGLVIQFFLIEIAMIIYIWLNTVAWIYCFLNKHGQIHDKSFTIIKAIIQTWFLDHQRLW